MSTPGVVGTRIDRYLVERLLGAGGYGAVYRARHVRTEAEVALKVLRHDFGADPNTLDRFMREAKAAATIGDEHVVQVLDADVTKDDVAFIAMELLQGCDLKELDEREGPLKPARVLDLICQVLDGLQAAHQKGVVHRDMKPGNVFIVRRKGDDGVERERAKLLDFGISKMVDPLDPHRLTATNTAMGTPGYMAYEQFFDARDVDARSDVYAVSAMTYELLAGRKPYLAGSFAELVTQVRSTAPPPLRDVAPSMPTPLCAIIDKGLARKRERRWESAAQMAAAFRGISHLVAGTQPARKAVARGKPATPPGQDSQVDVATAARPRPLPVRDEEKTDKLENVGDKTFIRTKE